MDKKRVFEIDLLRVIAIILMVTFHLVFDLDEFFGYGISYESTFWLAVGKISALLFIFVSGISSCFSRNSLKRGTKVLLYGMIVTVFTYIFDKNMYVRFGILHFLGVAMILSYLMRKLPNVVLFLLAVLIFLLGSRIDGIFVRTAIFLPLGIMYRGFGSYDYYPLIPYFSPYLMGILVYRLFYSKGRRIFKSYDIKWIKWISSNSLKIYIIHQPIIMAVLYLIDMIKK